MFSTMSRSIIDYTRGQYKYLPLAPTPGTCKGATYIVTGSNVGLGLEATRHLSALGAARVIMAVRNVGAGEAAKAEIESSTQTSGILQVWPLDLSSFDSVKAFSKRITEQLDRVDGVIENAGVALLEFSLTEGCESTITVNVLSTLLLAVLLLPKLKESAKQFGILPHLSIIASETGFFPESKVELDKVKACPLQNLSNEALVNMQARYDGNDDGLFSLVLTVFVAPDILSPSWFRFSLLASWPHFSP
jgi:NAD(P)-dependent dehydrogenase (short-subunit alcohol dehydrogenase family)